MLLSEARDTFLTYMVHRKGASHDTIKTYRPAINKFIEFTGDIETTCLSVKLVDEYAEYIAKDNLSPRTYRNKITIIRSFVKFLYAKDLNDTRPESIDVPRSKNTEMTYMTDDEAMAVIEAARPCQRDYALILTLLSTGLRVSELCALRMEDILDRTVVVRHGKGDKTRCTFISQEAKDAIDALRIQGYIFGNRQGEQMSRMGVLKIVKKLALASGVQKNIGVHTFRHTFATRYLNDGGKIEDLQQLLGHTNIQTTLLYLHFTNSHLKNAYDLVEQSRKSKLMA